MNLIEFLAPDFVFENEAGCLKQLVHDGWKQVNVITSVRGSVRGGHYHKFNREAFYVVSGAFKLVVWQTEDLKEEYSIQQGDFFALTGMSFIHLNIRKILCLFPCIAVALSWTKAIKISGCNEIRANMRR